jgi:hypothetical protein
MFYTNLTTSTAKNLFFCCEINLSSISWDGLALVFFKRKNFSLHHALCVCDRILFLL